MVIVKPCSLSYKRVDILHYLPNAPIMVASDWERGTWLPKIDMPNLVTSLKQTPIFEWYVI